MLREGQKAWPPAGCGWPGMGISGLDGTGLVKPCSSMARSGSSSAGCGQAGEAADERR